MHSLFCAVLYIYQSFEKIDSAETSNKPYSQHGKMYKQFSESNKRQAIWKLMKNITTSKIKNEIGKIMSELT